MEALPLSQSSAEVMEEAGRPAAAASGWERKRPARRTRSEEVEGEGAAGATCNGRARADPSGIC